MFYDRKRKSTSSNITASQTNDNSNQNSKIDFIDELDHDEVAGVVKASTSKQENVDQDAALFYEDANADVPPQVSGSPVKSGQENIDEVKVLTDVSENSLDVVSNAGHGLGWFLLTDFYIERRNST